jgi:hypothetical protein
MWPTKKLIHIDLQLNTIVTEIYILYCKHYWMAMGDFSSIFPNNVVLNHIWPHICFILLVEDWTACLFALRSCNKTWKDLVDRNSKYGLYLEWCCVRQFDKEAIEEIKETQGYIHKICSHGCTLNKDFGDYLFWKILGIY